LACCIALQTGCSYQYVDDDNVRHVWGLVHLESKEVAAGRSDVNAQQVTTLGMAILRLPESSGISLGYSRNFSLVVNRESVAGQLSYGPANPVNFAYRDYSQLVRENYDQ